jgi:hypothetical protein
MRHICVSNTPNTPLFLHACTCNHLSVHLPSHSTQHNTYLKPVHVRLPLQAAVFIPEEDTVLREGIRNWSIAFIRTLEAHLQASACAVCDLFLADANLNY